MASAVDKVVIQITIDPRAVAAIRELAEVMTEIARTRETATDEDFDAFSERISAALDSVMNLDDDGVRH